MALKDPPAVEVTRRGRPVVVAERPPREALEAARLLLAAELAETLRERPVARAWARRADGREQAASPAQEPVGPAARAASWAPGERMVVEEHDRAGTGGAGGRGGAGGGTGNGGAVGTGGTPMPGTGGAPAGTGGAPGDDNGGGNKGPGGGN